MVDRMSRRRKGILTAAALVMSAAVVWNSVSVLQAEEYTADTESAEFFYVPESEEMTADVQYPGYYTVPEGWILDTLAGSENGNVYKYSENFESVTTSVITCSYRDTNYTVLEYEQLRDMLTNDIVYSRVNAEISTNATYTDNKDYLYILTADDPSLDYREIFYYVVGDMKCFCVTVQEYRSEAEYARAVLRLTPEEVGRQIAAGFLWQ